MTPHKVHLLLESLPHRSDHGNEGISIIAVPSRCQVLPAFSGGSTRDKCPEPECEIERVKFVFSGFFMILSDFTLPRLYGWHWRLIYWTHRACDTDRWRNSTFHQSGTDIFWGEGTGHFVILPDVRMSMLRDTMIRKKKCPCSNILASWWALIILKMH